MSAERNQYNIGMSDLQNPLFLCPSEGPGTLAIQVKLLGAKNYWSWRRSVEIALATKRKLGFIRGTIPIPIDDHIKAEMWDTCNCMIIVSLHNVVTASIGKSILFLNFSWEIWLQLEQRFSLSNGSRKYRIDKEIYEVRQNMTSVTEYYTRLKWLWEELDGMYELPKIAVVTNEIAIFLQAVTKQKGGAKVLSISQWFRW